jgi:hypothetical protein
LSKLFEAFQPLYCRQPAFSWLTGRDEDGCLQSLEFEGKEVYLTLLVYSNCQFTPFYGATPLLDGFLFCQQHLITLQQTVFHQSNWKPRILETLPTSLGTFRITR